MKLDRNINHNQRGKYALLKLRKLDDFTDQGAFGELAPPIAAAIKTLEDAGILDWGLHGTEGEFFVIRLRDAYATPALQAYAGAAWRDLTGGFGGVQGGYNWQLGSTPFVIGIETDISFGSISSSWGGTNQFDPYYGKDSATMFGTVRGRIGYAFDRVLVYGTGGLAWGEQEHGFGCDAARVAVTNGCQKKVGGKAFYVSKSPIDVGYTVGGGVEYALTRNWTVKAEYLFTDYGTNRIDLVDPNYPAAKTARNFDTTIHTTKLGVNYRF